MYFSKASQMLLDIAKMGGGKIRYMVSYGLFRAGNDHCRIGTNE